MGRFSEFLSAKWDDSMNFLVPNEAIIICQMERFNGFLSVKWGDYYYMPNAAIHHCMLNGAVKTIMPIGAISGS